MDLASSLLPNYVSCPTTRSVDNPRSTHSTFIVCAQSPSGGHQPGLVNGSSQQILRTDPDTKGVSGISSMISKSAAAMISIASEKSSAFTDAVLAAFGGHIVTTEETEGSEGVEGIPRTKLMVEPFRQGRLVEGSIVYRQTFVVRSYEVGVDKTASLETFLNQFQESALNHVWMSGLLGDGFGATHGMIRNHLIWVVSRMQVEIEKYPAWGDVLELDTWVGASGKNGMRRDWLVRDYKSGQILARATSTWVMMNQKTRRLSKMPDEVREEISPWFIDRCAIKDAESSEKINKLGDDALFIHSDLQPRRSDLDMNQHINNVKYVGWMLETVPGSIQDNHELQTIILEYRRECGQSDVVQSLTSPHLVRTSMNANLNTLPINEQNTEIFTSNPTTTSNFLIPSPSDPSVLTGMTSDFEANQSADRQHYTHLLRLQKDGSEIVRGRSVWRSRYA